MGKNEAEVQGEIQVVGPEHHTILMRNNSGALKDVTGRLVRYGLGNISKKQNDMIKSSDLIGVKTLVITEEMVGKMIGVITAVEVKEEGWTYHEKDPRERAQKAFINFIKLRGGMAGFAQSVQDFKNLETEFMTKLKSK